MAKTKHSSNFQTWVGEENSYLLAQTHIDQAKLAEPKYDLGEDFNPSDYGLLVVSDGVGIINISGSMVSNAPAYYTHYGIIGYNVIKETLVIAAQDPNIHEILLNIDSGGGSASGVDAVGALIKKIAAEHKPVTAFTEGMMCSAAYWIGSSADSIYATRMSTVGSIGVIAISMEFTKMMDEVGITPTVFRAGEFKALGTPYEQMDEKTAAEIQAKLDTLYSEFTTTIASERNLPISTAKASWAEGRTFFGFEALDVGLVDSITTFEDLTSDLIKKNAQTSGRMKLSIGEHEMPRQKTLNARAVAVIASGGTIDAALELVPAEQSSEQSPTGEPTTSENEGTQSDAQEVNPTIDATPGQTIAVNDSLTERVITLTVENRILNTELATIKASHDQFKVLVAEAVNFKKVALGGTYTDYSQMTDDGLIALHAEATASFTKAFPIGGLTETAPVDGNEASTSAVDSDALDASKI